MLRLLREHGDAVEADLSALHHIDYRDRWRFDPDGRRRLTLRRIGVLVRHLPADSATARALGGGGWLTGDYLLAHLFQAFTGEEHPALPRQQEVTSPERAKKRADAIRRKRERERAIAAGEIT